MSRLLKSKQYKLAVVGVRYRYLYHQIVSLKDSIYGYLNDVGISYTQEDVEIIEIAYKQKYGK